MRMIANVFCYVTSSHNRSTIHRTFARVLCCNLHTRDKAHFEYIRTVLSVSVRHGDATLKIYDYSGNHFQYLIFAF